MSINLSLDTKEFAVSVYQHRLRCINFESPEARILLRKEELMDAGWEIYEITLVSYNLSWMVFFADIYGLSDGQYHYIAEMRNKSGSWVELSEGRLNYTTNDGFINPTPPIIIGGLRVVKNTDNTHDFLETNDFAEGWVTPTLFIEGVWKGPDDPSQSELEDEDNWSNSLKIV